MIPSSSQRSSKTIRRSRVIIIQARIMGDYRGGGNCFASLPVRTVKFDAVKLVLLKRGDTIGHIAVVDICGVYLPETIKSRIRFARGFQRQAQIVAQRLN